MQEKTSGVHIGSVGGDIQGSVIAGGDVSHVSMGGASEAPSLEQLRDMLDEIRRELAGMAAQTAALARVSPAAQAMVEASAAAVQDAARQAESPSGLARLRQRVEEGTALVSSVLRGAKTAAEDADEAGESIERVAEKAGSLLDKLGTVAAWAAKLAAPLALGGLS